MRFSTAIVAGLVALVAVPVASLADTVRVGVLLPYSWVNKNNAEQSQRAIDLFVALNGDTTPGGHTIELIEKDTTGPRPDVAGRVAQELVTRDDVDILMGVIYSNNAFRVAEVAEQGDVPLLIANAGAAALTMRSENLVRFSFTMWHAGFTMGEQAASRMGFERVATMYADYAPGKDSAAAFRTAFEAGGGEVIDEIPLPFPQMPDHAPFLQRVLDARPDALYVFVPAGTWATSLMNSYGELGLREAGVLMIGPGDITTDEELNNMGSNIEGMVTAHHYSAAHDSLENRAFVQEWHKAYGDDSSPNFMSAAFWDTMAAIYEMTDALDGDIETDAAIDFLRGWTYDSPRGPIMIDPETRDIVQNVYMRIVDNVDGQYQNTEFQTFPMVRDMCKEIPYETCQ